MAAIADAVQDESLDRHIETFERDGYVHLRAVYPADQIAELHRMRDQAVRDWLFATGTSAVPEAIGDVLERFPRQGFDAVTNALPLGLAEAVMGPIVQLDSTVLVGCPSVSPDLRSQPVAWHRDRFGFFPVGAYTPPQAIIGIAYLQEMTDDVGPLRIIPASHRHPVTVDLACRQEHQTGEHTVHTEPGDLVFLHHNLLHSGTRNVSGTERRFFGFTYSASCHTQQDNFSGPNCQALAATARRTHDRRILRLLGHDPLVDPRQNTGFVQPHTAYWPTWHDEDVAYAAEAATLQADVDKARRSIR